MKEATYFIYDGVNSRDLGVSIVSTQRGLFNENIVSKTNIETSKGNSELYSIKKMQSDALVLEFSIFIEKWKSSRNIREVLNWLKPRGEFKPLSFDTNPNKVFYAIRQDDVTLTHNGAQEGYMTLKFVTDSPFVYSSEVERLKYTSVGRQTILLNNEGDERLYPIATIKQNSASKVPIRITNKKTGKVSIFNNINLNEELEVDFLNKEIKSSHEYLNIYRYKDFNKEWFFLEENYFGDGANEILLEGNFTIEFTLQHIYSTYME